MCIIQNLQKSFRLVPDSSPHITITWLISFLFFRLTNLFCNPSLISVLTPSNTNMPQFIFQVHTGLSHAWLNHINMFSTAWQSPTSVEEYKRSPSVSSSLLTIQQFPKAFYVQEMLIYSYFARLSPCLLYFPVSYLNLLPIFMWQ